MFLLVTIPLHGFVSVVGKEMGKFKVYWFSVIGGQVKTIKKGSNLSATTLFLGVMQVLFTCACCTLCDLTYCDAYRSLALLDALDVSEG